MKLLPGVPLMAARDAPLLIVFSGTDCTYVKYMQKLIWKSVYNDCEKYSNYII